MRRKCHRWIADLLTRYSAIVVVAASTSVASPAASKTLLFDRAIRDFSKTQALIFSSTLNGFFDVPGVQYASAFRLLDDGVVTSVDWWGVECDPDDAFQITIYSNVDEMPGAVLASTWIRPQVVATPYYSFVNPPSAGGTKGDQIHFFSAELTTPFFASSGTEYFISIFNAQPETLWGWYARDSDAAPPNQVEGRQRRMNETAWFKQLNAAFVLHGVRVPEPSGLALFAIGCAAIGWRRH